jgi:hypothetical protein
MCHDSGGGPPREIRNDDLAEEREHPDSLAARANLAHWRRQIEANS